jgi:putative phosphoesterase
MKILVISDTHGDIENVKKILANNDECEMVIHLGDYFRDALKLQELFPNFSYEYVYGNSDFMIGDIPIEKIIEVEGVKIFITHGHKYSVKWDFEKLYRKAENENVQALLFGHTHEAVFENKGNYFILNPGSTCDAKGMESESYAILEINNGEIKASIKFL